MRSTRRSGGAASLLAAALMVAASACGADSADQTDSSEGTRPPPADTSLPATTPVTPATTDAPEPALVMEAAAVTISAPFDGMVDVPEPFSPRWLVPWDDGFLAVGLRYPPPPLPDELPAEIAELFPPEVVELFPDGLPADQQQAMDILNEAGLLDVVMNILNEHPEAMDAVQSMPLPDTELLATWSTNGDAWTPVELSLPAPIGEVAQVTAADDRLTIAGSTLSADEGDGWIVTISSTTDLQDWDTASFPVARPEEMSEAAEFWVTPIAVAANAEHWVVRILVQDANELWSGAWDGEPTMSDARPTSWTLLATSEGFLDLDPGVAFSPDGATWTEAPGPVASFNIQGAAPFGDGVLAMTRSGNGSSQILLLDATGALITEVDAPEFDDGFSVWSEVSSPAMILMPQSSDPEEESGAWLLATTDARTWLFEELTDFDPNLWRPPDLAASNGTIVLVGTPGSDPEAAVWQRFTMPG